jgi:hypothetical protein
VNSSIGLGASLGIIDSFNRYFAVDRVSVLSS